MLALRRHRRFGEYDRIEKHKHAEIKEQGCRPIIEAQIPVFMNRATIQTGCCQTVERVSEAAIARDGIGAAAERKNRRVAARSTCQGDSMPNIRRYSSWSCIPRSVAQQLH